MARLNFEEKYDTKLRMIFSGILLYDTVRKYGIIFSVPCRMFPKAKYIKYPKGSLC